MSAVWHICGLVNGGDAKYGGVSLDSKPLSTGLMVRFSTGSLTSLRFKLLRGTENTF